jgi:hypothetical protein
MGVYLACALAGMLMLLLILMYLAMYKKVYVLEDKITYRVQEFRPNKHKALRMLYDLNHNAMKLIKIIKIKYRDRLRTNIKGSSMNVVFDTPGVILNEAKTLLGANGFTVNSETDSCSECVELILRNYNPDLLSENDPIFTIGDKAFTFNFKQIAICLRKKDWSFYDFNTLMFVFLHEVAHTGTHPKYLISDGKRDNHPPMFWRVFKFLLREAVENGFIIPIDYDEKNYVTYCGVDIKSNPIFDNTIEDLI